MIRVYFIFEDPLDDTGLNLSYVDVPTKESTKALSRVQQAASSGELWKNLCPDKKEHMYVLLPSKMQYLDISELPEEVVPETTLPL
ncbi:MAG TPA: hypothetical protein VKS20_00980 [Candidatus Acidoferrales bacterium]|nr:hypothetical protein [Candidatus Acidoferrales bacterium]